MRLPFQSFDSLPGDKIHSKQSKYGGEDKFPNLNLKYFESWNVSYFFISCILYSDTKVTSKGLPEMTLLVRSTYGQGAWVADLHREGAKVN
jgi:hypothetical protein